MRGPCVCATPVQLRGRMTSDIIGPPTSPVIDPKREVVQLYREILQTARAMTWKDEHGRPWGETVQASARREFEDWSGERDPALVAERIMVRASHRGSFSSEYTAAGLTYAPTQAPARRGYP